jgi:hypothetical protein
MRIHHTPVKSAQNHTQNLEIGDTGDNGVIFRPKRLDDIEKVDGGTMTTTSVGRKMRLVPKEIMTYEKRDWHMETRSIDTS